MLSYFCRTRFHYLHLCLFCKFLAPNTSIWEKWSSWDCDEDRVVQYNFGTCFSMKLHMHLCLLRVPLITNIIFISIFKDFSYQRAVFMVQAKTSPKSPQIPTPLLYAEFCYFGTDIHMWRELLHPVLTVTVLHFCSNDTTVVYNSEIKKSRYWLKAIFIN